MVHRDTPYYVAFSHCLGIGPVRFKQLLSFFGSVEKAYQAPLEKLREILGQKTAETLIRFRRDFSPDSILQTLLKKNIQVVIQEDPQYPPPLAQISDSPICLYVKGNARLLNAANSLLLAIVGTRKPTSYGVQATKKIISDLPQECIIVSGMAVGIDSTAHWSAIDRDMPTIAVLGCGVDIIYPPSNRGLYNCIVETGGAVVSEFPPGRTVHPGLFVARNRIISGMARGVLVVEGAKDSGALITARYGAEQGRDVFALPSPITSPQSAAPHILIKQGAKMVTSADDILEEYAIHVKKTEKAHILKNLKGLEKEIMEQLIREPLTADDLALNLHISIGETLHTASLLEIKGCISKNAEGKFFAH